MHGRILDAVTKKLVVLAVVDIWQASTNGLYELQDKDQVDHNLRGKFETNKNGRYEWYCLKPTPKLLFSPALLYQSADKPFRSCWEITSPPRSPSYATSTYSSSGHP